MFFWNSTLIFVTRDSNCLRPLLLVFFFFSFCIRNNQIVNVTIDILNIYIYYQTLNAKRENRPDDIVFVFPGRHDVCLIWRENSIPSFITVEIRIEILGTNVTILFRSILTVNLEFILHSVTLTNIEINV